MRLAQEVEPVALEQVADGLLSRHLFVSAIVVTPLVVVLVDSTSVSAAVATLHPAPSDALLHHAMGT
jgi:hypothetical protein